MKRLIVAALLALGCSLSAWAHEAVPVGDDPAIEARLNKLADTLRCLVCPNRWRQDAAPDDRGGPDA